MHNILIDTIVAPVTAPGISAIAVIRLSGNQAFTIADTLFKGKALSKQESHTLHYGHILFEGKTIDDVIISIFRAPHSYTREDVIEISCHGSPYIVQKIIEAAIRAGARPARAGEFTQRAYLNGRFDLAQAEAVADLIASGNAGQHELAIQQLRGGISHEIGQLRQELIDFTALIELELDFGEEDVEFANREKLETLVKQIQLTIQSLLTSFKWGNAVREGITTVLVGRPNAGKSTLLNALLKEERAIVSHIAGTTRDTIEEVLHINGIGFRLTDTAGIREARDEIESIGIRRTMEKVEQGAIIVYLFDMSTLTAAELKADILLLKRPGVPLLAACNKIDEDPGKAAVWANEMDTMAGIHPVLLSAKKGEGIENLKNTIYDLGVGNTRTPGDVVVANTRHYHALHAAHEALAAVLAGLHNGLTGDLLSHDLRQTLYHLGEITGEVTNEDILDAIFSKFCIGK